MLGVVLYHPAPPANLHVQPLLPVGRRDSLLVDLREVIERERVLEALFEAADRLGKALPVIIDESSGRPPGALFIRLEPNLLQMGREPGFLRSADKVSAARRFRASSTSGKPGSASFQRSRNLR